LDGNGTIPILKLVGSRKFPAFLVGELILAGVQTHIEMPRRGIGELSK
jgi:hypothetical protein